MNYWIKEDEVHFLLYFRKKVQCGCGGFLKMLIPKSISMEPRVKHLDLESCDICEQILLGNISSLPARFCISHSKMFDFS